MTRGGVFLACCGQAAADRIGRGGDHADEKTSEAILALKPVTFRYKEEIDPDGIAQFGLVAEELEKVKP